MGTGIARGFLAAMDTAWMVRSWGQGHAPLEVLAERSELTDIQSQVTFICIQFHNYLCSKRPLRFLSHLRESVYRLLPQTTPENVSKNYSQYRLDPASRYPNINMQLINAAQV